MLSIRWFRIFWRLWMKSLNKKINFSSFCRILWSQLSLFRRLASRWSMNSFWTTLGTQSWAVCMTIQRVLIRTKANIYFLDFLSNYGRRRHRKEMMMNWANSDKNCSQNSWIWRFSKSTSLWKTPPKWTQTQIRTKTQETKPDLKRQTLTLKKSLSWTFWNWTRMSLNQRFSNCLQKSRSTIDTYK